MQLPILTRFRRRMTLAFTRKPNYPVPKFDSIGAMLEFINWGNEYVPDPWNGKRDPMFHPTHSVKRIMTGDKTMSFDCDDHAALWCAMLMKSGLATSVDIGSFGMENKTTGERSYHAICLFTGTDGKKYWIDYGMPMEYTKDWEWAHQSARVFGEEAFEATIYHIRKMRNDSPVFGEYETADL